MKLLPGTPLVWGARITRQEESIAHRSQRQIGVGGETSAWDTDAYTQRCQGQSLA
jgi:hypothetical protein